MGRTSHSNYVEAARQVLGELGGGPIASRDLVAAAQERGLIGNGTWVYHNFLRRVRVEDEFDTSRRGYVALANTEAPAVAEEAVAEVATPDFTEAPVNPEVEMAPEPEAETEVNPFSV
jgi:hypothetical protein